MKMLRGRLKPEDEKIIQRNFSYLKIELEARDLLDDLFTKEVISLNDKMRINEGKSRQERNDDLLVTLLHSGPGPSFSCFLSSLEVKYPHVYELLKTKDGVSMKTVESTERTGTLMTEVDNSCTNVKDENDQIQRLKEEIAQKDVTIENLNQLLTEVTVERAQKDVTIENLNQQLTEVTAERAQKDVTIENLNQQLTEVTAEREQKDVRIENLNQQLREVTAERDNTFSTLMKKCDDNKQLQARLGKSEQRELLGNRSKLHMKAKRLPDDDDVGNAGGTGLVEREYFKAGRLLKRVARNSGCTFVKVAATAVAIAFLKDGKGNITAGFLEDVMTNRGTGLIEPLSDEDEK